MPFFSKLKPKGSHGKKALEDTAPVAPPRRRYDTQWSSETVFLDEVEELIHACTVEMKSRAEALDTPFLLLPFRPDSDTSGVQTFIANYFKENMNGSPRYRGQGLKKELRLTDPLVLCCIMKWCWSRIPGGVVSWPVYEGFAIGERESHLARNAFDAFIPIGVESAIRRNIIFDFFELLAAVAAHGKTNGLGGRKLSRLAGWWAFEHSDNGNGFEGGYQSWSKAADATSHLFFAYLRTLSPEANPSLSLIERIPRSLQALLAQTEYPPEAPTLLQRSTPRVVMLVNAVSPTPFALLRRGAHFEYRSTDKVLHKYQEFEDPLNALTEECKRVLNAIASSNIAGVKRPMSGGHIIQPEESWSSFQSLGFSELTDATSPQSPIGSPGSPTPRLSSVPRSGNADMGRPTTPSWADFMSSGFAEDEGPKADTLLFPPEQVLPPLGGHRVITPTTNTDDVAPGELAAITNVELDDAFWWVWMTSLAREEPNLRKSVFGRCAVIETNIMNGSWLIMEEQVKGASPDPTEGAVLVEKKSRLSRFTSKTRIGRKNTGKKSPQPINDALVKTTSEITRTTSIGPDQQAKIRAAAKALAEKANSKPEDVNSRRGRAEEEQSAKTHSVLTLGLQSEAGPAMQWAKSYDKKAIRAAYLGDNFAGKGDSSEDLARQASSQNIGATSSASLKAPPAVDSARLSRSSSTLDIPAVPAKDEPKALSTTDTVTTTNGLASPMASPSQSKELPTKTPATVSSEVSDATAKEMGLSPSSKVGRKPLPVKNGLVQEHPALRKQIAEEQVKPQSPTTNRSPAVLAAQAALQGSPESQKSYVPPTLKKQPTNAGLKKLFGKKWEPSNRDSFDFSGMQTNGLVAPNSEVGRRLSFMRSKKTNTAAPAAAAPAPADAAVAAATSATNASPATPAEIPEKDTPSTQQTAEPTMPSDPILDGAEPLVQPDVDSHFSNFDQGPIEDMPSAMPVSAENSDDEAEQATAGAEIVHPEQSPSIVAAAPEEKFATPMEQLDNPVDNTDAQSEASFDGPTSVAREQDRWAQIRQNAQNRHRASEEQSAFSRPTQDSIDEGETSGEETIESRVARIKARVAELTGNATGGGVLPPVRT